MFSSDYRGKTLDFEQYSDYHRISISRFLRSETWDEMPLSCGIRRETVTRIYEESRRSRKPVLCIVDDTIASKAMPSSKAEHPIESAYFHFSLNPDLHTAPKSSVIKSLQFRSDVGKIGADQGNECHGIIVQSEQRHRSMFKCIM